MSVEKPDALPQIVIDEAWVEYLYPRAAVEDLADPSPTSGFTRAMRVLKRWAEEHDAFWAGILELTEQRGRESAAAELERLAKKYWSSSHVHRVCLERAAELRGDRKAGA